MFSFVSTILSRNENVFIKFYIRRLVTGYKEEISRFPVEMTRNVLGMFKPFVCLNHIGKIDAKQSVTIFK